MRNPQLPVLSAELLERFFRENWGKSWRLQATHQENLLYVDANSCLYRYTLLKLELSRVCWGYDIYAFVYTCLYIYIYRYHLYTTNHRFSPPVPLWGLTPKYTSPKKNNGPRSPYHQGYLQGAAERMAYAAPNQRFRHGPNLNSNPRATTSRETPWKYGLTP